MSVYTTEVRFICESESGLETSGGSNDVNSVIANSWNKIFTSNAPFFDESYRSILCQKILKHYYLREICCETVGMWKLWMNTRLEEIMPYYNQLYESTKIEFNPMHDVNVTRTHDRNVKGTSKEDGTRTDNTSGKRTRTGNRDSSNTSDETRKDLYSDTPQGAITNLENERYLTNARKITNNATEANNINYNESEDTTGKLDNTTSSTGSSSTDENYLETVTGKQGAESFSDLLNKYRETFINIDLQVIEEFSDLFLQIY